MNGRLHFSPDYATARGRFLEVARRAGLSLSEHAFDVSGPAGETLAIDVGVAGSEAPEATVVVSSGLHGVEGYLGSAIQHAFLSGFSAAELPEGLRLVFVHALNPYGFAHVRRVNENNVDLNRNFLRPGEAFSGSPEGYARLNGLLNPTRPPRRVSLFLAKAASMIARYGLSPLKDAVAGGQYDFPQGVFFGGHRPERTQELLDEHLSAWIGAETSRRVLHVDFHSGLGASGTYKLLVDHPHGAPAVRALMAEFGADVVQPWQPDQGVAYEIRGGLGTWAQSRFPECSYDVLCAEFGTLPILRVIRALHLENRAHHWGRPGSASTRRAKAILMEAFAPKSKEWRDVVVPRGVGIVERALRAAQASRSAASPPLSSHA